MKFLTAFSSCYEASTPLNLSLIVSYTGFCVELLLKNITGASLAPVLLLMGVTTVRGMMTPVYITRLVCLALMYKYNLSAVLGFSSDTMMWLMDS